MSDISQLCATSQRIHKPENETFFIGSIGQYSVYQSGERVILYDHENDLREVVTRAPEPERYFIDCDKLYKSVSR